MKANTEKTDLYRSTLHFSQIKHFPRRNDGRLFRGTFPLIFPPLVFEKQGKMEILFTNPPEEAGLKLTRYVKH